MKSADGQLWCNVCSVIIDKPYLEEGEHIHICCEECVDWAYQFVEKRRPNKILQGLGQRIFDIVSKTKTGKK